MPPASVSIVIPTRDRPALLEEAVRSVLAQTRPVDQIVVVDDGSQRAEAVERLAEMSSTIQVVRSQTPRGIAGARNLGLARARGDHLLFLDDDDLIRPRLVEDGLAAFAERPEADVVVFQYGSIPILTSMRASSSLDRITRYVRLPIRARPADGGDPVPRAVLERRPVSAFLRFRIPVHSCLLKRQPRDNPRFPESLPQGEDTYFWISLAAAGRRFVLVERPYALVRRHAGNTSASWARYYREIQPCYEQLLADGLLTAADDVFLAHLKLLWLKTFTGRRGRLRHLGHLLRSPRLLAFESAYWVASPPTRPGMLLRQDS